ncbi:MAG: GNAT family N-acetyltransferase [bacterium]|nr:GNAT family N-acetyltransferase [bacterium]
MSNLPPSSARTAFINAGNQLIPTSAYNYTELAEIYNQARVDYIVPMPMNNKRMQEYVQNYDISLDGSVVAINGDNLPCGVGMLGLRDKRGWITRLGVIPDRRKHHVGQAMMESLIGSAQDQGATLIQLEVILGNDPARLLFEKLGFVPTRELLVIRRPPSAPTPNLAYDSLKPITLSEADIPAILASRTDTPSWIEETRSLLNTTNLRGLRLVSDAGESGWIVFQRSPFQLTHFVLNYSDTWVAKALLYHVHKEHPMQDTKIENVDVGDQLWDIYQQMGYLEIFRRTEMFLHLK